MCRNRRAKSDLLRYVWDPDAGMPVLDEKQNMAGRGAYCCITGDCKEQYLAIRQRWKRSFRLG